jgi:hypothetical protein
VSPVPCHTTEAEIEEFILWPFAKDTADKRALYQTSVKKLEIVQCVGSNGICSILSLFTLITSLTISGFTLNVQNILLSLPFGVLMQLKELKIVGVYDFSNSSVEYIASSMKNLEILEISCSPLVTDTAMLEIGRKLRGLKEFNYHGCTKLSDNFSKSISLLLPGCRCIG